jgi:glycogen debranching enzyme
VDVTAPWAAGGGFAAAGGQAASTVTVMEGSTFCVSEPSGDLVPDRPEGLFVRDTRVLSRWELTVDGRAPQPLSVQQPEPFQAAFLARMPPVGGRADSTLLTIRRRYVGDGMREQIAVRNTAPDQVRCVLALRADADFADLFEVKDGRAHPADDTRFTARRKALVITGRRDGRAEAVRISCDGATVRGDLLTWELTVPGHGEQAVSVEVLSADDVAPPAAAAPAHRTWRQAVEPAVPARRMRQWRRHGPKIRTADAGLAAVLDRSIEDLGALRIFDPEHPARPVVAAGAPWFMALFGRDSLITSWMLLPWDPSLAVGTLQTLAAHQGEKADPASEEEPGRILHEVRFGPAATVSLGGRRAYYGTADATPLFVMLVGELARWGRHDDVVAQLMPHVDRALDWIEKYGDADGDGFVEYSRKTSKGLVNQGWKDSWDGINFADGRIAEPPVALAEVQAYCYAAFRARARLARRAGDQAAGRHWAARARQLKQAFNERFWLSDQGWYAIALDCGKRPVDALTSNIGHCLWTGIADREKAAAVAAHLLSPQMFSGFGIRTLGSSMAAYNPMSYHNGSVWPHDNAIAAAGLARYGFIEQAQRVTQGILGAARFFGHRLPELFCGFDSGEFPVPVPYPAACSPQAWAAAAPLQLLYCLLRFAPDLEGRRVWCAPAIPAGYLPLRVSRLRLGAFRFAISVHGEGWKISGLDGSGIEVIRAAKPLRAG